MGRLKVSLVLLFALVLVTPVFAQGDSGKTASPEKNVALPEEPSEGVVTGEVTSLDTTSSTITLKTDNGKETTFSVVGGETILWKGIEDIELSDITIGQKAEVGYYTNDKGIFIASWVDLVIEQKVSPAAPPATVPAQGGETKTAPTKTAPVPKS